MMAMNRQGVPAVGKASKLWRGVYYRFRYSLS